ncbi:MAG: undecaprenyl/decaprenyl-phosphate alpha-N-acetylglucosaminyl 1-phosphate transferase [Chloroflexota bacterium]|nr:undecaprenyl/decaprenyl-phosphate alpha-N-acetylglucosaminyl 1-phosphate transferase [Chloroflexota bacterium]
MTTWLGAAVALAFLVSLAATYGVRLAARRFDWLDHPSRRKLHTNPVPLMGGIAMYSAFVVAVPVAHSRTVLEEGAVVLAGATLLLVTGIIDDRRGMRPFVKLLAQVGAALLLIVGGVQISIFTNDLVNACLTIFWIVGICNAMNLLDNMDGLSGGVAAIACASFAVLAGLNGQIWVSVVAAVLFGAILGFLWFNWNPATIFMGDAGSLLLGFLLAVLAIKLRFPGLEPERAWIAPLLVLIVPIADTSLVTISRLRRGVSISSGGRDHISHRLLKLGLTVRQAVGLLYAAALAGGVSAVLVTTVEPDFMAAILIASVTIMVLIAVTALERLDLSDTGQVVRPMEQRPVARIRRQMGQPLGGQG